MRVLLILGLAFGTLVSFASQAARTQELQQSVTVQQKAANLEVSLVADKRTYKRTDDIDLEVKLTNTHGVKDIFVYGTLQFGFRGSFMLYHLDAKGKDVPTQFFPEAQTRLPDPKDTSAFVKLLPDHFLGTYYRSSIHTLNMVRPGKYSMWVEYSCPISIVDVELKPFFGKENGIIKSNVVRIEVLP
jgi:hypothetical protein